MAGQAGLTGRNWKTIVPSAVPWQRKRAVGFRPTNWRVALMENRSIAARRSAQRVADDRHRAEAHRGGGDHRDSSSPKTGRARPPRSARRARCRRTRRTGSAGCSPSSRATAPRAHDAAQVALHQRDARALHRDVGAGAHRDADVRLRQRRRVVDAVAGHRDDAPCRLQLA